MFERLEIVELKRLIANLVRIGTIASVNAGSARAKVAIGKNTTAPLPWLSTRAGSDRAWWAPSVGEQVVVLSIGGDLAQGVILPALYSDAAPAPADSGDVRRTVYVDGATIAYDTAAHKLTAEIPGDAEITVTGKIVAIAEGEISATSATRVKFQAPALQMQATGGGADACSLEGNFTLHGNLEVDGNIHASGNILADGSNSNHHDHPEL